MIFTPGAGKKHRQENKRKKKKSGIETKGGKKMTSKFPYFIEHRIRGKNVIMIKATFQYTTLLHYVSIVFPEPFLHMHEIHTFFIYKLFGDEGGKGRRGEARYRGERCIARFDRVVTLCTSP